VSTRENQNWDRNRFERQRELALQAHDAVRLVRVYLTATQAAGVDERITLLRQALSELQSLEDSDTPQLDVEIELAKLHPTDSALYDRVSAKLRAFEKYKELGSLLESLLGPTSVLLPATQLERRADLLDLYANRLGDRGRSAEQLVHLLESDTLKPEWLESAEELSRNRSWLKLLGPNLARAYERLGQPTNELALLNRELEVARGPRLAEVRKRLAILRQDVLDDADGALEMLEPLVSADPSDDETRARFLELSIQCGRKQEAARRLTRAMTSIHEMAARARIGLDLGKLWQQTDDNQAATAAYLEVLRTRASDPAVFAAAEALDALGVPLDADADRDRLWAVCKLSGHQPARRAAAEALLKACEGEPAVDELKATALETIAATVPERAIECLLALETLHAARRDFQRLIPTLEQILAAEAGADDSHRRLLASQRAERLGQLGSLRRDVADDPHGALSAFAEALSIDPQQGLSLDALMEWMNNGPFRLEAAAILEPHLRSQGSHVELLVALGARTEFAPDPAQRLAAAAEALTLFEKGMVPTDSAAWFCAHGLKASLACAEEQVPRWVAALEQMCADNPAVEADGLETALADRPVTSSTIFGLATRAIFRLVEVQRFEQAAIRLASALKFDPTEPQLLALADVIGQVHGDDSSERLRRIDVAIAAETGARRVSLLTIRASIERSVFGPGERELATWQLVLDSEPSSLAAHQALCEIYTSTGKLELLEPELRRALDTVGPGEKDSVRWKLAELLASQQRGNEALELYREVLQSDKVDALGLAHAAKLAEQAGDTILQGQVLRRQVEISENRLDRAAALEALGTHVLDTADTRDGALEAYREALRAYIGERQFDRARTVAERLLALAPTDSETAAALVHLAFDGGDLQAANAYFDSVAQVDLRRAYTLLLELQPLAQRTGDLGELVNWLERLLWQNSTSAAIDSRALLVQKAHWLAAIPERLGEASDVWRSIIETQNDPADIAAYQQYLSSFPDADVQRDGRRWLLERQVSTAADPSEPLVHWAQTEADEFDDLATAVALCERAIEQRPNNLQALELLATLRLRAGAAEGALQALESLRRQTDEADGERIDIRIAQLLAKHLDQPELAFARLRPLLSDNPNREPTIQLIIELSKHDRVGPSSAQLFEELADTWMSLGVAAPNLFDRVQSVARCALPDSKLWPLLEDLGPRVDSVEQVVKAYGSAIAFFQQPDVLERLGQRMIAFAEQWAPDASTFTAALLRVLEAAPRARWALDRVTFVLSQQGRFGELLDWFDRAIAAEDSAELRHALLDEAIVTARDLAKDNERAIAYLERQCTERPDDAKSQAALERLYRRGGYTRKLIDLLTNRMQSLADPERAQVQAHIATRWLELGEPEQALEVTEDILARRPDDTSGLELLERIVDSSSDDATVASGHAAQLKAAERLFTHYIGAERYTEAIRVLEVELGLGLSTAQRTAVLHDLADLRTNRLNDFDGAFRTLVELVALEPAVASHRLELEQLAERLSQHREYAEALVSIALAADDQGIALPLLADALRVYGTRLDDPEREAQLYEQQLAWAENEQSKRETLLALESLYGRLADSANLCRVLEMRAACEPENAAQLRAWRDAARLALSPLNEAERAVSNWRQVLRLTPRDREALDGLVEALGQLGEDMSLIDALEQRASQTEGQQARNDLVRAASLAEASSNTARALALWQRVANRFGDDQQSALAIADLLEKEERWHELRDHLHEYCLSIEGDEKRVILIRAAEIELRRMNDTAAAVSSYTKARAWQDALGVLENTVEPTERSKVAIGLIELADGAWKAGDAQAEPIAFQATLLHTRCTLPSIESLKDSSIDLAQSTKLLRRAVQVRDRLLAASERPFARERRRALLLEAARVTSGWLREPLESIRLFGKLFAEDPIDAAAEQSFGEFSELLQSQGLWSELAELLEHRAKAAPDGSPRAIGAWLKAGDIWENRANDPTRALAAYRYAADSDSVPALEAVARLARQLDHAAEAARALEQLVAHAGNRAPIERVIELVDAYLASGDLGRARLRLESTLQAKWHPAIDERLEHLYRRIQQWSELVQLLKTRAQGQTQVAARIDLLREAAELQKTRLNDKSAAALTLTEALALEPDRSELQLELARTCAAAGQHARAVELLEQLIGAFGARRSRARAELHTELSSVLEAMGQSQRAFEELKIAASIDQAQPRVLYSLGKSALAHKDYDLAEQTLSSLLLLLHRSGGEAQGVGQAHAYLVLSEVATRNGDAVRARDYIESAFETALESPEHERRLLTALVELDKPALIQRALELRWSHVTDPVERCALLRDRLDISASAQELSATKEKIERRARETWARLSESAPADAFRNLADVFDWLGDTAAAAQALNTFADRVDWSSATPSDAAALLRLAHRELTEGWDFAIAHRHMEASLRLGITLPELAKTVELILSVADTQFAPLQHRVAAIGLARGLVEALAVTAPATDPALGAQLLLKLVVMAERLDFGDVIDRALAAAASLDPNRDVLMAQLRRLRTSKPESPERWELAEQLLSVETGASALALGVEIAQNAREHRERARAARALSKVIGNVEPGSELALDLVELLAWSGLPQRAMDLIESSPSGWITDERLVTKVADAIDNGVLNLELADRLAVELRWIDWLIANDKLDFAQQRLSALASEMSEAPVVLERLARLAQQRGLADEAIKARLQLLNVSTDTEKATRACELYDTCAQLNRPAAARAELELAHRAYPDDREVTRRLSQLYEKLDAPTELAQLILSSASALTDPEAAAESLVRAAQLVRSKSPSQAFEFLQKAEQLHANARGELELARLHASAGRTAKAIELYTLAANSADSRYTQERAHANYELAQVHLGIDQLAEAHEALNAAFRFRPKNAVVALQVAQLAIDLSDLEVAKRALRVLITLKGGPEDGDDSVSSPTKSKAYYYLGRMLSSQGDLPGARRMIGRALEEDSNNESARLLHDRLG